MEEYKKNNALGGNMKALVINCSPVRNGATAEIVNIVKEELKNSFDVKTICIDDYKFEFCKGCRSCHKTAKCKLQDDFVLAVQEFEKADIIVSCAPSYWADVPGQYKAFIDRWTPWCNTHDPHAKLTTGKKGYSIVQRTGPGMHECDRLIQTIEHFYGHLEIESADRIGFTSVENKEDLLSHKEEIVAFCKKIAGGKNPCM